MSETLHVSDLKSDPNNARKHNPRNHGVIEDSMRECGFGRSILLDENNVILAGNASTEVAAGIGIENVRIIDAEGDEIIAVRRKNLTKEQKLRLAIADNRAAELAEWDKEELKRLREDTPDALQMSFFNDELDALLGTAEDLPLPAKGEDETPVEEPPLQPASHVRMVQLFLSDETLPEFSAMLDVLMQKYGTDNATDTIMEAMRRECNPT